MSKEKYELKMKQLKDLLDKADKEKAVLMSLKIKNIMYHLSVGYEAQNKGEIKC